MTSTPKQARSQSHSAKPEINLKKGCATKTIAHPFLYKLYGKIIISSSFSLAFFGAFFTAPFFL